MKNKYISILLICVLFCLSACGIQNSIDTQEDDKQASVTQSALTESDTSDKKLTESDTSDKENTPAPAATTEPTEESESQSEADVESVSTESVQAETDYIQYYSDLDAAYIAKILYTECGSIPSDTEKACVAWCILNRVDSTGDSIYEVISAPGQFAFSETTVVWTDLLELSYDVLERWNDEKNGEKNVGRVLPSDYMWFSGDGEHNYFRNAYNGEYSIWDYSLESPYKS